jgi:hypothetical protein
MNFNNIVWYAFLGVHEEFGIGQEGEGEAHERIAAGSLRLVQAGHRRRHQHLEAWVFQFGGKGKVGRLECQKGHVQGGCRVLVCQAGPTNYRQVRQGMILLTYHVVF